jgi:polyisoprenyl-phosphate glycosyltransferase
VSYFSGVERRDPPGLLSVVVPLYDEEASIDELYQRLCAELAALPCAAELVFVDDGSHDRTYPILAGLVQRDQRVRVVRLSRNFGHQRALTAGLDAARGDAVVTMDGDLQHPPELIGKLVDTWRDGYEVVHAIREERVGDGWAKRTGSDLFYRFLGRISDTDVRRDAADFRLIDREVVDTLCGMRETRRYIRGMVSWVGFSQADVTYRPAERFAGSSKYSFRRMASFAVDGVLSFSTAPLRVAMHLGFLVSALAFLSVIVAIVTKLAGAKVLPGWASIVAIASFLGGVQLIVLGIIGLYVGAIYQEVKQRPLYVVRSVEGASGGVAEGAALEQPAREP